ncbi:MAG: DUF3841 domain-containing protein [Sedimentibacter sp.]|uniref:DUF3841 domain-containing protein n=1 Tax=Sedimentibacter sp. TaxID=1960295 RepID=UPI002980A26A|nr:DUF3841 domain-containing protein [Sedimentibacter sp.]MDW5299846.1 DUF3841 domain-containing protein [Sedimentibacter sp.]
MAEDSTNKVTLWTRRDIRSLEDEKTSHFYPEERKKVMDSWIRVFDTDVWDIFRIQANICEIRPEMIIDIISAEN